MFPQFGQTAASITKASTMVFRFGTDAHLYDDPEDVSIAPLLDSKFDSEKVEALKRLLALIAQGCDVVNFFPQAPSLPSLHGLITCLLSSASRELGSSDYYSPIEQSNREQCLLEWINSSAGDSY